MVAIHPQWQEHREEKIARLTEAAYHEILASGYRGSFIDLELSLWAPSGKRSSGSPRRSPHPRRRLKGSCAMNPTSSEESAAEEEQAPLQAILDALQGLRFGSITVIVQDGVVVQLERVEKRRLGRGVR